MQLKQARQLAKLQAMQEAKALATQSPNEPIISITAPNTMLEKVEQDGQPEDGNWLDTIAEDDKKIECGSHATLTPL